MGAGFSFSIQKRDGKNEVLGSKNPDKNILISSPRRTDSTNSDKIEGVKLSKTLNFDQAILKNSLLTESIQNTFDWEKHKVEESELLFPQKYGLKISRRDSIDENQEESHEDVIMASSCN